MIADQFKGRDVFLQVIVNPLVNLIWLAGLVFLAGSLVTLWPDAREQRRLARRFAERDGALVPSVTEGLALALGAALAVLCVLVVARPFLREPEVVDDRLDEPSPSERERIRLEEERDRALEALKELEFDHRTGKISDADYREALGPLRAAGGRRALPSGWQ